MSYNVERKLDWVLVVMVVLSFMITFGLIVLPMYQALERVAGALECAADLECRETLIKGEKK